MKNIKLQIDEESYENKELVKKDIRAIKMRLQHLCAVEVTLQKLLEEVKQGKTISPAVMKGTTANDFLEQQLFLVDIDNNITEKPILQVDEAIKIYNACNIPVAFYYNTFSYTKEKPKYRLGFILEKTITEKSLRDTIAKNLCSLCEQADTSCTNADRIFFGTDKEAVMCDTENTVKIEDVLRLAPPSIKETKSKDTELEKLKSGFDFLGYLKERNGKIVIDNIKYTMFENCEVCGHHNDLVYYKETNTFYCHSSSGKKGGSIIDYLMAVDKLTLKQSIDKFKHELCGIKKEKKSIKSIHSMTAKELSTKKLPKSYIVVKGLLGQGVSVLAGQPKQKKSWCALNLCNCVSTGQPFLGLETTKSACLYLTLEDSFERLQDRMKKMLGDTDIPDNLHLAVKCDPLNNGLIEELEQKLKEFPDIKLIVIDTLQKVRGVQGRNQNTYDFDYKELGKLKEFADEHKICILVVHHLRKMKDHTDPFNNISGSTGITGAADTTMLLYKDDFKDTNTHFVTQSRDFESIEKILYFDKYKWNVVCDSKDFEREIKKLSYRADPIVITINKLLEKSPEGVKISSMELLKKIIETTGAKPKQESTNALTRHITNKLQLDLLEFDGIHYEAPNGNGGSAGRKMFFSKTTKDI